MENKACCSSDVALGVGGRAPGGFGSYKVDSLVSVDDRGQMVLPKELRDKAGIKGATNSP
jgi:hypothetical protein